jgi:peptidoglycan hydrolase CwlO-like protein
MKTWGFALAASAIILLGTAAYCCTAVIPHASAQTLTSEQRAALQAEYDQLQKEIAQWQKVIDDTKAQEKNLQGDVTTLNAQIKKAQAEISQRTISINGLANQIQQKSASIATLEERLQKGRDSLAKMLREKNEAETVPLAVVALSAGSLSSFLADVDNIDVINQNLQDLFAELRGVKTQTEAEKQALAAQQNKQLDARHDVQLLATQINTSKQQKSDLLTQTKGQEAAYNQVLTQKQARAQTIRNALFNLRDAQGISFEKALGYATVAEQKTGVRAALILAILSQESDLGANIGSCYVTNLDTGDGMKIKDGSAYDRVMKAPRDTQPFKAITDILGLDWKQTPVSCPLGRIYTASRGYGGALGPSQFIASTWQLFAPRIETALGLPDEPNPWDPQHAIMATALYMEDLGAAGRTYTSERNAACKYYSGRSCDSRTPINYTYGNSVVSKADTFQQNIDFLNNL